MATMLKLYKTEKEMLKEYKADVKKYSRAKTHWEDKSIETVAHDYIYRTTELPDTLVDLHFDAVMLKTGVSAKDLPEPLQAQIANVG